MRRWGKGGEGGMVKIILRKSTLFEKNNKNMRKILWCPKDVWPGLCLLYRVYQKNANY